MAEIPEEITDGSSHTFGIYIDNLILRGQIVELKKEIVELKNELEKNTKSDCSPNPLLIML